MANPISKQGKTRVIDGGGGVTLRARVNVATGTESLYLDYAINGKRKSEFLKYKLILNPKNRKEEKYNEQQIEYAKKSRSNKWDEIRYNVGPSIKSNLHFTEYFDYVKNLRMDNGDKKAEGSKAVYKSVYDTIEEMEGDRLNKMTMKDITEDWLKQYKTFLLDTCKKKSTASLYFSKVIAVINKAVKEKVLKDDPSLNIPRIPMSTPEPKFLTLSQLRKLYTTPCESEVLRNALFTSLYSGLRIGDLIKMKWADIRHSEELGDYVMYRQKKTQALKYQPIKKAIIDMIGKRGKADDLVFPGLKNNTFFSKMLNRWTEAAGITEHVTPHMFRHSHAIMLGANGANLLEIQNSLGHKDNKTTSKYYARVLQETQRKLIDNLPELSV